MVGLGHHVFAGMALRKTETAAVANAMYFRFPVDCQCVLSSQLLFYVNTHTHLLTGCRVMEVRQLQEEQGQVAQTEERSDTR